MNKKLKLLLEDSFLFNPITGLGAYTLIILKILNLQKNIHFQTIELKLSHRIKLKYIFQTIWLNTVVLFITYLNKPEIFIFPAFIMPFFTRKKTKYITVIHDLCHLRKNEMTKYSKFIFDLSTKITIKKADIIVTVSNTIRQELINTFKIAPDRIKVVYNSISDSFINIENNSKILEKYNIENNKYILSVATLNKRKNIPELIKAFESISNKYPELKLVLVGGMGNEDREKLTKHPNIIFTGYIPDKDIPSLYQNALLYVFPSLYEGFGIPLIEAQYSECPVLCSDIPVFREVAGNGAEFCGTDAKSISAKMEYLINNPARRNELAQLGKINVKRFSIETIAQQLLNVLKS